MARAVYFCFTGAPSTSGSALIVYDCVMNLPIVCPRQPDMNVRLRGVGKSSHDFSTFRGFLRILRGVVIAVIDQRLFSKNEVLKRVRSPSIRAPSGPPLLPGPKLGRVGSACVAPG